jgi:hypothetical protein
MKSTTIFEEVLGIAPSYSDAIKIVNLIRSLANSAKRGLLMEIGTASTELEKRFCSKLLVLSKLIFRANLMQNVLLQLRFVIN